MQFITSIYDDDDRCNEMVNEKTIFDVVVYVGRAIDQAGLRHLINEISAWAEFIQVPVDR